MESIWIKIKTIFTDKTLRNRVLFVLGSLVVFRLLSAIPIPGVDAIKLQNFVNDNQFVGVLNVFSGGGLSTLSIIMLGVGPYITASIVMQLLTMIFPKLKIIQGLALLVLLRRQGIMTDMSLFSTVTNLSVIVAGSMLIMWIGELVTEFGIGNGVSLIIFAGIVASIPKEVSQFLFTFDIAQLPLYLLFLVVGLLIIAGVVVVTEAERPVPVTYAKQVRGDHVSGGTQTYLPIRVNQAGVIPIIFALSILLFPQLIGNALAGMTNGTLLAISRGLLWFVQNTWLYSLFYFIFVFLFTYFYTAVTFDPEQVATNLQKNGAFVPGIRPGEATRDYISKILNIGGTALLIVVSVVLDLIKKTEAQLSMREY